MPTSFVTPADDITTKIKAAQPGDVLLLRPGAYKWISQANGKLFSPPLTIAALGKATIQQNPNVGSTDACIFGPGEGGFFFQDCDFQGDDRAAVKTTSGVGAGLTFNRCSLRGQGSPYDSAWVDVSKWGFHAYDTADVHFVDCDFASIFHEHAVYLHNIKGDHSFENCTVRWCGRTAIQVVNRTSEGAAGVGNISVLGGKFYDTCLEDGGGGSMFTFRGGMPSTKVALVSVYARLGCDPLVQYHADQVTGFTVVDAGDQAYPGGTGQIGLINCDMEVGTVHGAGNNARRAGHQFSALGKLIIQNSRLVQGPNASPILLDISPNGKDPVQKVQIIGQNTLVGRIRYRYGYPDGGEYADVAALEAAHPELFV